MKLNQLGRLRFWDGHQGGAETNGHDSSGKRVWKNVERDVYVDV